MRGRSAKNAEDKRRERGLGWSARLSRAPSGRAGRASSGRADRRNCAGLTKHTARYDAEGRNARARRTQTDEVRMRAQSDEVQMRNVTKC
eukprot:6176384-Pleurochrysis_carterae.AAC.2